MCMFVYVCIYLPIGILYHTQMHRHGHVQTFPDWHPIGEMLEPAECGKQSNLWAPVKVGNPNLRMD